MNPFVVPLPAGVVVPIAAGVMRLGVVNLRPGSGALFATFTTDGLPPGLVLSNYQRIETTRFDFAYTAAATVYCWNLDHDGAVLVYQ